MAGLRRPGKGMIAVAGTALAVLVAIVAIIGVVASNQESAAACPVLPDGTRVPTARAVGTLQTWAEPCVLPSGVVFMDGAERPASLDDFAGKTVVLNLWATWCPPCLREMPSLDRLQAAMGGEDFVVVALNQDRGGAGVARAWLENQGLERLDVYADPRGMVPRAIAASGLPTTIILDPQGRELARLVGEAEWDSPDMQARLRGLMAPL